MTGAVLAQNTSGGFTFTQHSDPGVGVAPYGLVTADVDGDLDLATANDGSNAVTQ